MEPASQGDRLVSSRSLVGRFVVRLANQTATGLAAHEAIELLESAEGAGAEVFRINRADADGRMELVGVSAALLREEDCLLFSAESVKLAREAFDALVGLAESRPPPCRIEFQLVRVRGGEHEHVVVLVFSRACADAVCEWSKLAGALSARCADAGRGALQRIQTSMSHIVIRQNLEPIR